jgi:hypothetical protein
LTTFVDNLLTTFAKKKISSFSKQGRKFKNFFSFSTLMTNQRPKSFPGIHAISEETKSIVAFKAILDIEVHLDGPACKNNEKKHLKKENFMSNKKEQLSNTYLFSRESKRWIITSAPGIINSCEKVFLFLLNK